ncbi:MAG: FliM/FliN family flagellar motor switch protein [Bryobacteraceae bacterium]|jgi:flagellar motor switch protein FliM
MSKRLSQEEIDQYLQTTNPGNGTSEEPSDVLFDFRRVDRILQSQMSAVRFLHEQFIRTMTSSLSVYLRTYVTGHLIGAAQLPFGDFLEALPTPTCMANLTMKPYDGQCMLEVNQSLISPILDIVLGGNGKNNVEITREISSLEKDMLEEGLFRIIAHDLTETWSTVAPIEFAVVNVETNPQLARQIPATEAVVAIMMGVRVGEVSGMINFAVPSINLKTMRQNFDQRSTLHRTARRETETAIKEKLVRGLVLGVDCELRGSRIRLRDLLAVKAGDVVDLGVGCDSSATIVVSGRPKFKGCITSQANRMAVLIESVAPPLAEAADSVS